MRRVRRGSSPEVVVGPCDYSSPCSSAEASFRELDDVFLQLRKIAAEKLEMPENSIKSPSVIPKYIRCGPKTRKWQTQTRIWLGEVLHLRFNEETFIADLLADGELLFQVSKVVWKMLSKKHVELKHSKMYIYECTSSYKNGSRYMPYPKVDSFLRICQSLGLTGVDLFSPSDVVEKRDTRRVCMCIRSLSKKARTKDLNVPDFDIVTYTIAMPTNMVGCIRRRLEQSWWSSSSSSCTPCMDWKEICRQRRLVSDYMWYHGSCSESDDVEDAYREYELQNPISMTSYDDADISGLIGVNLPGSGSVTEQSIYPLQNFIALGTQQQDDGDVLRSIQSVETYLDTYIRLPHVNTTYNGDFKVTPMQRSKSFPPCRMSQAHLHARTSFSCMEDISWLRTKTNSGTEISKFEFCHSPVYASSSRNLASASDSCLTVDAKDKEYKDSSSAMLQSDSIAQFLSESYPNLGSVKEEFAKTAVAPPPPSKQLMTCTTVHLDTIKSTSMLLLDKLSKNNGRHVLKYNNVFLENLNTSSCVNKNLMFGSLDTQSGNSDSILQNVDNIYSDAIGTAADDQSGLHIEELNVNPKHLENEMTCKVRDAEVSLLVSHNSGNTETVVCEDFADICNDFTGSCLPFSHSQTPEKNIQFIYKATIKGLPDSMHHGGASVSMLNGVSLNGNGRDSVFSKLCNLSVGGTNLDRDSLVWHKSQASTTDSDPHTSETENLALINSIFLDMSHTHSVSEELHLSQVLIGCSELNIDSSRRNKHCSQFTDVVEGASDSSISSFKQFNGLVLHNGDAFPAAQKSTMDFCGQLHNISSASGSFNRANDLPLVKDLIFEKLVHEDGKICNSPFENMEKIPVNKFCTDDDVSQSRVDCLSKASASFEKVDRNVHHIVVIDGKDCNQSLENQMNNLWMVGFRKQTVGGEHIITGREGKSLLNEPSKTCSPCYRICDEPVEIKKDSFMEQYTENNMNSYVKDLVQQSSPDISEVPKERCLTHSGTQPPLYAEESSVSNIHLNGSPRGSEVSEELCQEEVQKVGFDMSVGACLPVIELSERQASIDTLHGHLDQTEACILKTGDLEITEDDCLHASYLDTKVCCINLEMNSQLCTSDFDSTIHCDNASSTSFLEIRSAYVKREGSLSWSTACVSDMKNGAGQNIETNNHHGPLMDECANSMFYHDCACIETLNKDVEDDEMSLRMLAGPDERESEEAATSESKPVKKILLKSFAGGMTLLGAFFLLLHFRRRHKGDVIRNVVKFETGKASQERCPDKDKHSTLYPAENFKF